MKRFLSILLTVLTLMACAMPVTYAHSKDEHDRIMSKIFFGQERPTLTDEPKNALTALEDASYLAIDQANKSAISLDNTQDETCLNFLKEYGVQGLPESISEINFGSFEHRYYTHRGWDHSYMDDPGSDKAHWTIRKRILLNTTARVFGFRKSGQFLWVKWDYDEMCNSMAALIYYIHVLGDHQDYLDSKHSNYSGESPEMMPFVSENPNESDVVSEILKHLEILFEDRTDDDNYKSLMHDLKTIKEEAIRIKGKGTGEIDTVEKRALYKVQVDAAIDCLSTHVYKLLKNEGFWTKVFS